MTEALVAVVGNPNTGKSTLFNALTGATARVGNFPGVTVGRLEAALPLPSGAARAVDVPGTYSLAASSPDELIALSAVLGLRKQPLPEVLLVVVDAPRLSRNLYLVLQLLELELPVVVALNMMDEARASGRAPDAERLQQLLQVPVVPVVARTGEGIDALRQVLDDAVHRGVPAKPVHGFGEAIEADTAALVPELPPELARVAEGHPERTRALARWMLLCDPEGLGDALQLPLGAIEAVRLSTPDRDPQLEMVAQRYAWIDAHAPEVYGATVQTGDTFSDRVDRVLLHPVWGLGVFLAVMAVVFQALFSWSDPAIGLIEEVFGQVGGAVSSVLPESILTELLVDGVIGGVGAVVVFLPQIALLFLFIALLEDSGYLARAAMVMDRILRAAGLPGQAFVPLLSGYACAVPAILATRTMPRFRDRLLTMLVLPLTSCSARLPVYTLLIGALFPATVAGWPLPLRPTMLFGMYLLSVVVALVAAAVLGRLLMPGTAVPTLLELPPYRVPQPIAVWRLVKDRSLDFLGEAGRVILVATIVLWGLLSFPRYDPAELATPAEVAAVEAAGGSVEELYEGRALERSFGGRMGQLLEPVTAPLGYDWHINVGLIGAFAAREVFVATMGVVYGVGEADEESEGLRERMAQSTHSDGSPVWTPLVGASLMVFFAFAMQCLSTLAVLKRETGGWKWPAFITVHMFALAWISAFVVYQGGRLLGWT